METQNLMKVYDYLIKERTITDDCTAELINRKIESLVEDIQNREHLLAILSII